jgi:hypothetical protein
MLTATDSAGATPQHALVVVSGLRSNEQTPVSGKVSSTRRAASQSPAIAAAVLEWHERD